MCYLDRMFWKDSISAGSKVSLIVSIVSHVISITYRFFAYVIINADEIMGLHV